MKLWLVCICLVVLTSCSSDKYPDEVMYDMASIVKDVSQSVDGELKFGDIAGLSKEQIIQQSVDPNQLQRLDQLAKKAKIGNYRIMYNFQGQSAQTMICDGDIKLMEDAGCNATFDNKFWDDPEPNTCQFDIDLASICTQ